MIEQIRFPYFAIFVAAAAVFFFFLPFIISLACVSRLSFDVAVKNAAFDWHGSFIVVFAGFFFCHLIFIFHVVLHIIFYQWQNIIQYTYLTQRSYRDE